jgi:hypothetical protein
VICCPAAIPVSENPKNFGSWGPCSIAVGAASRRIEKKRPQQIAEA